MNAPPMTNSRGEAWTSVGRRNRSCAGSGHGNGGVMPPGRYERRRGCIGNGRHDKFWRTHWLACVTHLLTTGRIDITTHGVANALAAMSNATAEHVYPSQATIGEDCKRSASTVCRALARLRTLGMLEWDHRFVGPTNERPYPSATSNMYEFLLPEELLAEVGLRRGRKAQHPTRRRDERDEVARRQAQARREAVSMGAALGMSADTSYGDAVEQITSSYAERPELQLLAVEELDTQWRRRTS